MDYKTYRKYNSSYLASEFRSFGRNKLEDRKLALLNDGVDRSIEKRRKSFVSEAVQINKNFNEKVSKTTPSLESYLRKSQPKYNAWKLREQERLDRRYRGLYKTYLKEYSDLKLDPSIYNAAVIRKLSTSSDTTPEVLKKATATIGGDKKSDENDTYTVENDLNLDQVDGGTNTDNVDKDEELDEILALGQMDINRKYKKKSSVSDSRDLRSGKGNENRRFSTGGILFPAERKQSVSCTSGQDGAEVDKDGATSSSLEFGSGDKNSEKRLNRGDNSGKMNTLAVPKRKTKRSASLQKSSGLQLPLGVRLDRRSSLANIDIAVQYGN